MDGLGICYNVLTNKPAAFERPGSRPLHSGGVMMLGTITQKRCPRCGETKALSEFHTNKRTKIGVNCYCKKCHNKYTNIRYHNDPSTKKYILDYSNSRYARIKNDPSFIQKHNHASCNDRARKFGVDGSYTIQEWIDLQNDYGGRCAYCGIKGKIEPDHIVPLSRDGSNSIDNIVPCCERCNDLKHNTPLLIWMWKMRQREV
jgi:5-methylcytosine-specific restriction endonuclease McrA